MKTLVGTIVGRQEGLVNAKELALQKKANNDTYQIMESYSVVANLKIYQIFSIISSKGTQSASMENKSRLYKKILVQTT